MNAGMREEEPRELLDLAEAILDGKEIDWEQALSITPASQRGVVGQLRAISAVSSAHSEDPRSAPRFWGPLELLELIGEGAFGEVYRARDRRLDRPVALKFFRPHRLRPAQLSSEVIEEGRLLARVHHPNVVTVHGAEEIEGRTGIWMEYVDGSTLEEIVAKNGPLEVSEALRIGRDLCHALAALHDAGILHRDIKARNVMMETSGRVVLMDLGISCEVDRSVPVRQYGTPLYAAPETLLAGQSSRRGDIYSLGVLLYFLVSCRYPVAGSTLADIHAAHVAGRNEPLGSVRPDLPAGYRAIVNRALAADREDRFASVQELARAIEEALAVDMGSAPALHTGRLTENHQAYNRYLQGRYFYDRRYKGGLPRALESFREAIALDPDFALALVGVADCTAQLAYYQYIRPHDGFPRGRALAERALQLDPELGEAHNTLGYVAMFYDWDFKAAEERYRRAIALRPQYAIARQFYGLLLALLGRHDEALAEIRAGREPDPSSLQVAAEGTVQIIAGQFAEAIAVFRLTEETESGSPYQNMLLGIALWFAGESEEALSRLRRSFELSQGQDTWSAGLLAAGLAALGREDEAREVVAHLDALAQVRYVSNVHRMLYWFMHDRHDRWGPLLEAAIAERDPFLVWFREGAAGMGRWREDPRIAEPLQRAGLLD